MCSELDTSNDEEFARRLQAEFEAEEAGARLINIPPTTTPPPTMATSPQPLAASSSQDIETPSHLESDMEFARRLQEELDREEARATAAALSQRKCSEWGYACFCNYSPNSLEFRSARETDFVS